jgi:hypothetical protein
MLQENLSKPGERIRYFGRGVTYWPMIYTLRVSDRGQKPKPYSWEIFRIGEAHPFRKSAETFRTAILAKIAGQAALGRLRQISP